jgi:hypothetical protein
MIEMYLGVGDAIKAIGGWFGRIPENVSNALQRARDIVTGWINNFRDSGRALIEAFANGIGDAFGKARDKVKEGLESVRRMLPFSDAKEGPLSDLTLSGQRFSETFAGGIARGASAIQSAANDAFGGLGGGTITPSVEGARTTSAAAGAAPTAGQGGIVLNFHGPVYMRDDAEVEDVASRLARNLLTARAGSH